MKKRRPQPHHDFFPGDPVWVVAHRSGRHTSGCRNPTQGTLKFVQATSLPPFYYWYYIEFDGPQWDRSGLEPRMTGGWFHPLKIRLALTGACLRRFPWPDGRLPIWVGSDVMLVGDASNRRGGPLRVYRLDMANHGKSFLVEVAARNGATGVYPHLWVEAMPSAFLAHQVSWQPLLPKRT